ncbi:ADP-ribosyltransferase domain-containing protein [Hymenobacter weizhouensis]|uniref:ADP-ribosyltransferase domain-containing protein n=1 Tax=Hymenobacter sp. YIM 151500-1 TaxID=2987689 RepID=UPI0022263C42|nr:ADP-ribosyltransferase domain-containing protein [Hymenobacter sp. YIM 151500-1]UYZ63948.1 ADP-ribosyltransferase domain-containing protein [Hymenobacter sp. YIM 151500-1]
MPQSDLHTFVSQHLPDALRAVQTGRRATAHPELTLLDKALIYHYSEGGYEPLNQHLHTNGGHNTSLFGMGLVAALGKLPPYVGEANSGVYLSPGQLQQYRVYAQNGQPVSWPAFLSASLRITIARQYLHASGKNCLFSIQSRTGRLIEQISKFGVDGQNEYEVLFVPNTQFEVLEVANEPGYIRIVLDEL